MARQKDSRDVAVELLLDGIDGLDEEEQEEDEDDDGVLFFETPRVEVAACELPGLVHVSLERYDERTSQYVPWANIVLSPYVAIRMAQQIEKTVFSSTELLKEIILSLNLDPRSVTAKELDAAIERLGSKTAGAETRH